MKIHKELIQGTQEWFDVRKGKMTASNAQAIGNNGKGLETYLYGVIADQYSSGEYEHYTNQHIERGNELEVYARDMYELETGSTVEEVGFIELDEYSGCSPDGLIGEDGGVEFKCLSDAKHIRLLHLGAKEIEPKYIWQIQMCMLVAGRKWWDFVSYNPNFTQSLIIHRLEADKDKFEKLEEGLEQGRLKLKELNHLFI